MNNKSKRGFLGLVISGLLITGCANNQIANTEILSQQAKEQASNSDLSPQEAILNSAKLIEQSQNDQLHFFAPLHYSAAQDALTEAQDLLNSNAENALVLEQTFKVDSLLKAAYKNKNNVLSTLKKSLMHKQVLEELGSPETLPEEFQDTVDDLKDLIKEIEGGFMDKALQGQAQLLSLMTEVEIATLKKQHLTPAESMIDKAESIDADEYAEKTFSQAQQTLESATLFIEKNYKDRDAVRNNGLDALNAASHAYFIAQEATGLVELKRADAENKALYFESLLERVNKSLGIDNLNTMSLYDQSVLMAKNIENMKREKLNASNSNNEQAVIKAKELNKAVENTPNNDIKESSIINHNVVLEKRPIPESSSSTEDLSNIETQGSEEALATEEAQATEETFVTEEALATEEVLATEELEQADPN